MSSREQCLCFIESAISLLEEMKEILDDTSPDTPRAFLECAQDAQYEISKAIAEAINPILQKAETGREWEVDPVTGELQGKLV